MQESIQEILEYYAGRRDKTDQTVLVELLREIQEVCGCVPPDVQHEAAAACGVPQSLIAGLVRRYPSLREAAYRHVITACTGRCCLGKQGGAVLEALRRELGVENEGISQDGSILLKTQICLKSCGTAPNLRIDGTLIPHVSPEQIPALLKELRGTEQRA
ncbi:NADH-quinone oxidoreductase subunit NuoE family protein [Anaeromassilibacillus sp. An200]|uniref:NADH-quinone oxidoreductase subunit NuoE family protein n=1 Tax=Anaeromassilibacillus sp. An200 TaxID=1965587 RepID=UPI0013A653BA|nr:NAD(P)H-dependent oxidoreductase subunit E [Anaeromassilibacillus sp. An200]